MRIPATQVRSLAPCVEVVLVVREEAYEVVAGHTRLAVAMASKEPILAFIAETGERVLIMPEETAR